MRKPFLVLMPGLLLAELNIGIYPGLVVQVVLLGAGAGAEAAPAVAFRDRQALLVGELQEEQVGQLLDKVAVVDAVVTEGVTEARRGEAFARFDR